MVARQLPTEPAPRTVDPKKPKDSPLSGLILVLAIAVGARFLSRFTGAVPDVVLALIAGMLARNFLRLPAGIRPGVTFTLRYFLRAAVILFGAGLTFAAIVQAGAATLALVVACFAIALVLGLVLAKFFRLPGTVGILIGAGTAICGGSAILAIGPLLRAKDEEIAYAITTIFTFNIIALLLYPPLGHVLHLSETAFGSWAGTAVNDTSVVVATGYIFGAKAGAVATIVKLTRTVLLVPLAIVIGLMYDARFARVAQSDSPSAAAGNGPATAPGPLWRRIVKTIPWFILGFVAMAALNSLHAFSESVAHALTLGAGFFIVMVLAGVGLNVDIQKIRRMGIRPLAAGVLLAAVMAVVSLVLIHVLQIG
jgi:uncharacterized integral membrane protein (TIGR00698 family)